MAEFPAATPFRVDQTPIDVGLDGDGPCMHAVYDGNGRAIFGFDLHPDGSINVGYWDAEGEWVIGFTVGEPQPMPDNWLAQPATSIRDERDTAINRES